jgi:hypothetical protein
LHRQKEQKEDNGTNKKTAERRKAVRSTAQSSGTNGKGK